MFIKEFSSPEQLFKLRTILENLQKKIQNLPNNYQNPLAEDFNQLNSLFSPPNSAFATDDRAVAESGSAKSAETEYQTAYLFAKKMPADAIRQMEWILNSLNTSVLVFDQNGIIRRRNQSAVRMVGFDPVGMSN